MKYKELILRRMESMENRLKRLKHALNERNIEVAREILREIEELRDDTQSIIERED
jgi:predicted nucleotidyltransferase